MKKASIFSREYEKKIRRKRFAILILIMFVLLFMMFYIINYQSINKYIYDRYVEVIYNASSNNDSNVVENKIDENKDNIEKNNLEDKLVDAGEILDNSKISSDYYEKSVLFSDGSEVVVLYDKIQDKTEYIGLLKNELNEFDFDISPSKDKILVTKPSTEEAYLINGDLEVVKLDPEYFYSNSARTKFYKEDIRAKYESYPWYKNPKFLNDDTIVFVSNLPWFGKTENYIWKTDIKDIDNLGHFMLGVSGENIIFEELTEEGIKVNINNEMRVLNFSFGLN